MQSGLRMSMPKPRPRGGVRHATAGQQLVVALVETVRLAQVLGVQAQPNR